MGRRENNVILEKSICFAVRIVRMAKFLKENKGEYVISKQILKSGTSIGANVHEAIEGISRSDFRAKLYISLKEARETEYWLELLYRSEYITTDEYNSIKQDCDEILKLLVSICKSAE